MSRFFCIRRVSGRCLVVACALLMHLPAQASYSDHPAARAFASEMVAKHGFDRAWLDALLAQAERKEAIIEAMQRPAEKVLEWRDYRKIFIQDTRVDKGLAFWAEHRNALQRAERTYGVPAAIIVGIIGVETRYGEIRGNHRVLDALATLGFDYPPRAAFFSKQLEQFLLLVREQGFDPLAVKGSYAGAMGFGQFIPSSYRHYAVDFDGDGVADIIDNPVDAIGSVANYFHAHGWQRGAMVATTANARESVDPALFNTSLKPSHRIDELAGAGVRPAAALAAEEVVSPMRLLGDNGDEFWLGLHNFYVITRYNHSAMYAMAVYQLSQLMAERFEA